MTIELEQFGWNAFFDEHFRALAEAGLAPARVIAEHRGGYAVQAAAGELAGEVSGRFRYDALDAADFPAVGDWVGVQPVPDEDKAVIQRVLPRRTKFSRTVAGKRSAEQIVAANIDDVFIVASLSAKVKLRSLERYLTLAWDSGATPVLVMTKADLCTDVEASLDRIRAVAGGVDVQAVSSVTGEGMAALATRLEAARTVALLGPSGVGKSTLINHWCGEERLAVQPVRVSDQRGRHTTTHRELIRLPSGALILDTPGMRELQLWEGGEGMAEAFGDIESLAERCRFADCQHETEPDCAVREAIKQGELEPVRLESHRKVKRELAYFELKRGKRAQAEEKRRIKVITRRLRDSTKEQD